MLVEVVWWLSEMKCKEGEMKGSKICEAHVVQKYIC